jgi:hypothetical protein
LSVLKCFFSRSLGYSTRLHRIYMSHL